MIAYKDETTYLNLSVINFAGNYKTGLTVTYEVYDRSDDSLFASGSMSEIGSSGIYGTSVVFTSEGQYRAEYTTPTGYSNELEDIEVRISKVDDVDERIKRILGLSQENYRLVDAVYNDDGGLTSATIRIFASASDCENNVNPTDTYDITATYDANNRMSTYKVVKQ